MAEGDERLKGTRRLWLYNPKNMSPEQMDEFETLKDLHLKVARPLGCTGTVFGVLGMPGGGMGAPIFQTMV